MNNPPQQTSKPQVAVVGLGHLGRYHCQKFCTLLGPKNVLGVDVSSDARTQAVAQFGIRVEADVTSLPKGLLGMVIAAPTVAHAELSIQAIEHGAHVLVEKPIATTLHEAEAIIASAKKHQRLVQCGHTERFNPAVMAALPIVDELGYAVTERLAPFSGRSTDIDVILDLMIHDLDIVLAMHTAPIQSVVATGVPILSRRVDMANARIEFEDGAVAQMSASRASMEAVRKIRAFTSERYVSIDCLKKEAHSVKRSWGSAEAMMPTIEGEALEVGEHDALEAQAKSFLDCIQNNKRPIVDGEHAKKVLGVALQIKNNLRIPNAAKRYLQA